MEDEDMSTSTIKYYMEVDKYLINDDLVFELNHEKLKSVKINMSRESKPLYAMFIEFSMIGINSIDEAEELAQPKLFNILNELSVRYKMYAGNAYLIDKNINNSGESDLLSSITVRRPLDDLLDEEERIELFHSLNYGLQSAPNNSEAISKKLFRIALSNRDVTARYMLLYLILLYLKRDSSGKEKQKYVDEFIIGLIGVDESEYKVGPQMKEETIFTKLRNEIGHFRNVDLDKTKQEMERTIGALIDIVKAAVLENET
jgi:hypothetical protein